MIHIWLRAEQRNHETRTPLTPEGAKILRSQGFEITVEHCANRVFSTQSYRDAGCTIAPTGTWGYAPQDAIILGLKELPESHTPLRHRHIMFGHAFKGQPAGKKLVNRFGGGGGTLLDLEYLTDTDGRRVAAFGYWAGYAGAAVALKAWIAQQNGAILGSVTDYPSSSRLLLKLQEDLSRVGTHRPTALVIGALGRVGRGASDLCREMGVAVTQWDKPETDDGGPFPEILAHDIFLNCILAQPDTPVFLPKSSLIAARKLSVIGDIACDPDSDFSPIKVYDRATTWDAPVVRVHDTPTLDVTAIDNLPSMLPQESSDDFADQLLPHLQTLPNGAIWTRAADVFQQYRLALQTVKNRDSQHSAH